MSHLAYQVHPGRGPYLALLHGFLSSNAQWQLNLDALGQVCRPVTIELWGHGQSPAPGEIAAYKPERYVEELDSIRTTLGDPAWFVCGYSLGAGLMMRYAHTYPEHVLGQIITNSQSGFAGPEILAEWAQSAQVSADKIRANGIAAIERIAVHPRFAKRIPQGVREALVADASALNPEAVANCMLHTNPHVSVRAMAADNIVPALLCFGEHEKRFHPGKAWAEAHMARLTIIALDAGHAVNMEDAEGFNNAVTAFVRRHTA